MGLNNNEYQIERGRKLNDQAGLTSQCSFIKADFMKVGGRGRVVRGGELKEVTAEGYSCV